MTTIVYHRGVIAYDSRSAETGGTITDDNFNKLIKRKGVYFAVSGDCHSIDEIIKAFFGESYNKKAKISALIDDGGKVYVASLDNDGEFWKLDITGKPECIGSGADHALTAIDLGCTAVDAVKMAMKRDCFTGGRVRAHKVKK